MTLHVDFCLGSSIFVKFLPKSCMLTWYPLQTFCILFQYSLSYHELEKNVCSLNFQSIEQEDLEKSSSFF